MFEIIISGYFFLNVLAFALGVIGIFDDDAFQSVSLGQILFPGYLVGMLAAVVFLISISCVFTIFEYKLWSKK